jgi:hypothetical protein
VFVNLDFKCFVIMNDILLANLSIIEITFDNLDVASTLSVAILNALIALRVVYVGICLILSSFRY